MHTDYEIMLILQVQDTLTISQWSAILLLLVYEHWLARGSKEVHLISDIIDDKLDSCKTWTQISIAFVNFYGPQRL